MEAKVLVGLQCSGLVNLDFTGSRTSFSLHLKQRCGGKDSWKDQTLVSCHLRSKYEPNRRKLMALGVSCSSQKAQGSALQTGTLPASIDEALILKKQSEKIEPYLDGRCIYLVGMMGSGKTTVGRLLSEVLGYSFFDCDALIEQTVGGTSVADIFKFYGEAFFRDNETEVLHKLSSMHRLVVSTGGGAVVRPINWKYMQKGVTVWLDVPLEALARRIAAIGTDSRPLLQDEAGDAYTRAFKRLSALRDERGEAYANANARVSFKDVAMKLGCEDVCELTPNAIAIEVLVQIENLLKK